MATTQRFSGLWRNQGFLTFWAAQTVSVFGSQITLLALPLAAVVLMDASAAQMGGLLAAGTLPTLLFSLPAGVWVDRLPRRPVMIATDIGRAALLASVPLAWAADMLTLTQLYVVAFLARALTLLFDLAYHSYLPVLIGRDDLPEGNAKLQVSQSAALITGPGIAGVLVQILTAPVAILADACSFVLSALFLRRLNAPEPKQTAGPARSLRSEIVEGVRFIWDQPALRSIAAAAAAWNLFGNALLALYILFLTDELGLSAGWLGFIFGAGSVGFLAGAAWSHRLAEVIGRGKLMTAGVFMNGIGWLVVPLAAGSVLILVVTLSLARILTSAGSMAFDINALTTRQQVTPDRLLGRVFASSRFISGGIAPVGALLGGAAATTLGIKPVLVVCAVGLLATGLLVRISPLWNVTVRASSEAEISESFEIPTKPARSQEMTPEVR